MRFDSVRKWNFGEMRNGGGVGKAKRQNGIVGCREGTGGRRALAGMIVGRERGSWGLAEGRVARESCTEWGRAREVDENLGEVVVREEIGNGKGGGRCRCSAREGGRRGNFRCDGWVEGEENSTDGRRERRTVESSGIAADGRRGRRCVEDLMGRKLGKKGKVVEEMNGKVGGLAGEGGDLAGGEAGDGRRWRWRWR